MTIVTSTNTSLRSKTTKRNNTQKQFILFFILLILKDLNAPIPILVQSFSTPSSQKTNYFATCIPGLSNILSQEISSLGGDDIKICGSSGVSFTSKDNTALKVLIWSRTVHKLMEYISRSSSNIETRDDLYNFIRDSITIQNIEEYIPKDPESGELSTISCSCNGRIHSDDLSHSHYTALTVKNALVDTCRDYYGTRPNIDVQNADVPFQITLNENTCTFYRCLNNESLHKRGYKSSMHKASLKESLAAGLLLTCGWDKLIHDTRYNSDDQAILIDPMTGSGTLLSEALLIAADIAPGLVRHRTLDYLPPPVLRWKVENRKQYRMLLVDAAQQAKQGIAWLNANQHRVVLQGNDVHKGAVSLSLKSIQTLNQLLNINTTIKFSNTNCQEWKIPIKPKRTIVVCNPPWGKRLTSDVEDSWISLKTFLKSSCNGCEAWVLSGNGYCTRLLGMKRARGFDFQVGKERLKWLQYYVFDGGDGKV